MGSIFQSNPENPLYHSPTPGEITLMAGRPNSGMSALSLPLCLSLRRCGINAVGAEIAYAEIEESLQNCFKAGLKLFISNSQLIDPNTTGSFVRKFSVQLGLGGWLLDFSLIWNFNNDVQRALSIIKSINPDSKFPYFIGLSGDWVYDKNYNQLVAKDKDPAPYPTFLAEIQRIFQPCFWPVAYFPDLQPEIDDIAFEERLIRRRNFYKNLQYFAAISRYTGNPFWTYCRCVGVKSLHGFKAASPELSIMRGTVFMSLACGAQGIYYWKFFEENGDIYFNAPINQRGLETYVWGLVQTINLEVKAYNNVFCGCELIDCRFLPNDRITKEMKVMDFPIGPLIDVGGPFRLPYDVMITRIANKGMNYIVMVCGIFGLNEYSDPENDTFECDLKFSEYWNVYRLVMNDMGDYDELQLNNSRYWAEFSPGQYYIFRWE